MQLSYTSLVYQVQSTVRHLSKFSFKTRSLHHLFGLGTHLTSKPSCNLSADTQCMDSCSLLGPSCQLCDSSPAPLQQPRQITTGNKRKLSSKAASLSLRQENFPLFSRKIANNKYIRNQTILLFFSHLWELLLPWPKRSRDHMTIRA